MIKATHALSLRVLTPIGLGVGLSVASLSAFAAPGDTRFQAHPSLAALAADCRAKFGFACADLGANYEVRSDLASKREALRLYEQACRLGETRGCSSADRLALSTHMLRGQTDHKIKSRDRSAKGRARGKQVHKASFHERARPAGQGAASRSASLSTTPPRKMSKPPTTAVAVQHLTAEAQKGSKVQHPVVASQPATMVKASLNLPSSWTFPNWSRLGLPRVSWPTWRWIGWKWPFFSTRPANNSPTMSKIAENGRQTSRPSSAQAPSATSPFSPACAAGASDACLKAGQYYSSETGVLKSTEFAIAAYQRACDLNNASGCFALGTMYESGNGVRPDFDKAMVFYQRACSSGNHFACSMTTSAPPTAVKTERR